MRTLTTMTLLLLSIGRSMAQAPPEWLEQSLHGNGKINTVFTVVAVILVGIGIWLWAQDRRLTRMEKMIEKKSM